MTLNQALSFIDRCHVAPAAGTTTTTTLPFTLFDTLQVRFSNINRLTFYEFPYPETHFVQTIIPNLKHSLSQTLKHFYMLAGNLVVHADSSSLPELRYKEGDSVSLIFARANASIDFNHLVANEPRSCREFYPFVPQIVSESLDSDSSTSSKVIPVLSLQVTLFPNVGICIGVSNHHSAGDANTIFRFVKAWSTLSRVTDDDDFGQFSDEFLPLYDRSLIEDPKGIGKTWWKAMSSIGLGDAFLKFLPTNTNNKVRSTFVFDRNTVKNLKSLALLKNSELKRLSTFVVVCAYVWTCIAKSRVGSEENVDEDEAEHFSFVADTRGWLNPPIPDNYFGNCIVYCVSTAKVKELIEEGGFVLGVELIIESIKKRLYNNDGVLSDVENWFNTTGKMNTNRVVGLAGSPKYNYYDLDFGFGVARKFEFVSIDEQGTILLSGCRDDVGVIEVGLSFPKDRMDVFTAHFSQGLKALSASLDARI